MQIILPHRVRAWSFDEGTTDKRVVDEETRYLYTTFQPDTHEAVWGLEHAIERA